MCEKRISIILFSKKTLTFNKKIYNDKIDINIFDQDTSEGTILSLIYNLNSNDNIKGIIIELPLVSTLNTKRITESVSPSKDINGITSQNIYNFIINRNYFIPYTIRSIIKIIDNCKDKNILIVSKNRTFITFLFYKLINKGAYITISTSTNIKNTAKNSDIIISSMNIDSYIKNKWIKNCELCIDMYNDFDKECDKNIVKKKFIKSLSADLLLSDL